MAKIYGCTSQRFAESLKRSIDFKAYMMLVFSAYISKSQCLVCNCRSLIKRVNRRDPRQDPCGTPSLIAFIFEFSHLLNNAAFF